jgi:hypothetical protein
MPAAPRDFFSDGADGPVEDFVGPAPDLGAPEALEDDPWAVPDAWVPLHAGADPDADVDLPSRSADRSGAANRAQRPRRGGAAPSAPVAPRPPAARAPRPPSMPDPTAPWPEPALSAPCAASGDAPPLQPLGLLPPLPTLLIELQARARERAPLPPFLGSTLRGALGHALRDAACVTRAPTCYGCPHLAACPYGATWEAGAAAPLGPLDRGADPPRPYTLAWERPAARATSAAPCLDRGDPLRFRLALFGAARAHTAAFILALARALETGLGPRRARFTLEWARTAALTDLPAHPSARGAWLYADGRLAPLHALPDTTLPALVAHAARPMATARLTLHTPLALVHEARPLDHVRLDVLTQRLAERVARLDAAWGTPAHSAPLPWEALVELTATVRVLRTDTRWTAFERHGLRHDRAVPMGGLVGHLDLARVPAPLAALWASAEVLHLGKQATFGFGRVSLRPRGP